MSDPGSISRLDKLRALQEWLDWQLRQTRGRIQQLEAQERQEHHQAREKRVQGKPRVEKRESEKRRPRTFPDWGIDDIGVGTLQSEVHRGDCFAAGKRLRAISREQALAALADGAPACEVCRPDTALGAP
ncbi:DUF6233 domain-containing protein [Streptomyces sp. NPDC059460]|uniref:DUF6233 domain-containing protein n=1 Tax=Streptomyces sp. NPDC059460 TaxID=3346840 RepID=UPI0036973EB4